MYNSDYFKERETPHQRDFIMTAQWLERTQPNNVLDYGCGGGKHLNILETYQVKCAGYDPNNEKYAQMPEGMFDLVVCIDVLEHVHEDEIENILKEILKKASKYLVFSICDSRYWNTYKDITHVTCKSRAWWEAQLSNYFILRRVPENWLFKEQIYLCQIR